MVHIGGTIIMHVFSGVLDEEFLVELPPKSVLEHTIFKNFSRGHAPRLPSNLHAYCASHNIEAKHYFLSLETSQQNF